MPETPGTFGYGTFGDGLFGGVLAPEQDSGDGFGAGPPRFGLFPRFGLYPGFEAALPPPSEYRQISRPSESIVPGRGLRLHLLGRRYISQPSLTIRPGESLTIRSATPGTDRSGTLTVKGQGRASWVRGHRSHRDTMTVQGAGVTYFTGTYIPGTGPSVPTTILPGVVTFASGGLRVPLASAGETVRLSSGVETVRL